MTAHPPAIRVGEARCGRAECGAGALYVEGDPFVVAVATDAPDRLPAPTGLPVLDLNSPEAVAAFLRQDPARYDYRPPDFLP